VRYGELAVSGDGREVWAVRERHTPDGVVRDLAAVPLDASAADDDTRVRSIVGGSHFLAGARRSPDGRRVAWIAWNHPQMPWDGTELRVAELGPDGTCGPYRVVLGSSTESVLQPEWAGDDFLYALSDRSGWWNLHRVAADGSGSVEIAPVAADIGGPLWTLGRRWYLLLDDGQLLAVQINGTDRLARLNPRTGRWSGVELDGLTTIELGSVRGHHVCITAGGPQTPMGVRIVDLGAAEVTPGGGQRPVTDVRLGLARWPDPAYLSQPELATFRGAAGHDVHAIVYPPANRDHVAPAGELPPYVAFVHGGPTSKAQPLLDLDVAYLTSRGIGVVQVNYGGSTGYGRDYRRRLNGQWGVVDVADCVTVVRGLVDAGRADPGRLAIQGGSSGGWTVLSALTQTDAFACGISYYGVTDLVALAADTHDFESRYIDGLVGPLPEARAVYEQRAPANHLDGLSCPVLLLQGLEDPVVPPNQAERFRDALLAKGIPHAYRAYAGESHGFRRRETIVDATEASLSFLGQVLGFIPPDVPVLELWRPQADPD
jgi:dipeptidyl aminopeptidase/acylaminoacyl peptidase